MFYFSNKLHVASELTRSSKVDYSLCLSVAKNVAKTVGLMNNKCEQVMVFDDEASQVVGYPTDDQRTNVKVVNCLWAFKRGLEDILTTHKARLFFSFYSAVYIKSLKSSSCLSIRPLLFLKVQSFMRFKNF